jgi:hypothetical protein
MNALLPFSSLRPRFLRLLRAIRGRLTPHAVGAPLTDALWLTYARLADANPDCHHAPDFYREAAARVHAGVLEAHPRDAAGSAEELIEVIVRAVASLRLQSMEELQMIRACLIAAVAERSVNAGGPAAGYSAVRFSRARSALVAEDRARTQVAYLGLAMRQPPRQAHPAPSGA